MRRRSALAAAAGLVPAEAGGAAAAHGGITGVFDPVVAHRSWCPWVKQYHAAAAAARDANASSCAPANSGSSSSSSSGGMVAALRLGWAATVLALQAQLTEALAQAGPGGAAHAGLLPDDMQLAGAAPRGASLPGGPRAGQFDSTAAVLAKARRVLDSVE
jgi:hypothetical protein